MTVAPIVPITAGPAMPADPVMSTLGPSHSFERMLLDGISTTDRKLVEADRAVTAFAMDDSVPLHQVTYALEEAKLSLQLMLQVRDRLIDGYRRMMDMQV